jgi:hypothetical protein
MEEVVRKDILEVLDKGLLALENQDSFRLKELSNQVIHNASIFQDEDSVGIAVLMYALSKIIERGTVDLNNIMQLLKKAKSSIQSYNTEDYRLAIKMAVKKVTEADSRIRMFVNNVIEQAELKKGGKIAMHGVSVARAANMLGISRWELMQYLGHTTFSDEMPEAVTLADRLSTARQVFKNDN